MRSIRSISLILFVVFFGIAFLGGMFWANLIFVQHAPGGTDFVVPWLSIRNFVMNGDSPYGDVTLTNLQNLIYHQPAVAGQYPYQVNIPLFMLMLYLPLGLIRDLATAQALWLILLEAGLMGAVLISLRLSRSRLGWIMIILLFLYTMFNAYSVSMLVDGGSIALQTVVIFGALRAMELGSDEFAGALLALTLLNIEATGLVFLLIVIWAVSAQRWRILGGIGMTLVVFIPISLLLMPSWPLPFFNAVYNNWHSAAMPSTYGLFEGWMPGAGRRLAEMLAVVALAIIFMEVRAVRGKDVRWLFWTVALVSVIIPLLGMPYFPSFLVISLPAVILVVVVMAQRWGAVGLAGAVLILLTLFSGLWAAQFARLISIPLLVYPVIMIILLYWVRWGAVRAPRLWADEIAIHR